MGLLISCVVNPRTKTHSIGHVIQKFFTFIQPDIRAKEGCLKNICTWFSSIIEIWWKREECELVCWASSNTLFCSTWHPNYKTLSGVQNVQCPKSKQFFQNFSSHKWIYSRIVYSLSTVRKKKELKKWGYLYNHFRYVHAFQKVKAFDIDFSL